MQRPLKLVFISDGVGVVISSVVKIKQRIRKQFFFTVVIIPSRKIKMMETRLSSRKQSRKNKPITVLKNEHCQWFILP